MAGQDADRPKSVPEFEAGAGHVPVPDPVREQPVFEAGAGRGGTADHSIASPHPAPPADLPGPAPKGEPEA